MSDAGSWWCQNCKNPVDGAQVTFEERHEACGAVVEWIEGVESVTAELERLRARVAELEPVERAAREYRSACTADMGFELWRHEAHARRVKESGLTLDAALAALEVPRG